MCKVINFLQNNKIPSKSDNIPESFMKLWCELSVTDGLLLRQDRPVIPKTLEVRKAAHERHLGVVNTKRLLRSKVWFQNLDKEVETEI